MCVKKGSSRLLDRLTLHKAARWCLTSTSQAGIHCGHFIRVTNSHEAGAAWAALCMLLWLF
jgi:hypothetical protein